MTTNNSTGHILVTVDSRFLTLFENNTNRIIIVIGYVQYFVFVLEKI